MHRRRAQMLARVSRRGGETTPMHSHPACVAYVFNDHTGKAILPPAERGVSRVDGRPADPGGSLAAPESDPRRARR